MPALALACRPQVPEPQVPGPVPRACSCRQSPAPASCPTPFPPRGVLPCSREQAGLPPRSLTFPLPRMYFPHGRPGQRETGDVGWRFPSRPCGGPSPRVPKCASGRGCTVGPPGTPREDMAGRRVPETPQAVTPEQAEEGKAGFIRGTKAAGGLQCGGRGRGDPWAWPPSPGSHRACHRSKWNVGAETPGTGAGAGAGAPGAASPSPPPGAASRLAHRTPTHLFTQPGASMATAHVPFQDTVAQSPSHTPLSGDRVRAPSPSQCVSVMQFRLRDPQAPGGPWCLPRFQEEGRVTEPGSEGSWPLWGQESVQGAGGWCGLRAEGQDQARGGVEGSVSCRAFRPELRSRGWARGPEVRGQAAARPSAG